MEFDTSGPWGLHPPGLFNFAAITKKCPRRSASSARAPHKRNFCAPHVDRFTLSLTNIAGLRTNGAQLKHFLHHSKPDVVCITETKLVEGVPDSLVSVPGYSIFRRDRKSNPRSRNPNVAGGGIAVYVKFSIPAVPFFTSTLHEFRLIFQKDPYFYIVCV